MKRPDLFRCKKAFIKSMKELIKHYENAIYYGQSKARYAKMNKLPCFLCEPVGVKNNQETIRREFGISFKEACGELGCPWIVITGHTCDEPINQSLDGWSIHQSEDIEQQQRRIEQLREWIEIYEEYKK